jgi:predicted PurR-regulated permease PerM
MTGHRKRDGLSLNEARRLHHQMPRWVIILLVAGVAIFISYYTAHLLMTLTIAAIVSYIFSSAVSAGEKLGIKRSISVVALFVLATVALVLADIIFAPYLKQEIVNAYAKLPDFSARMERALLSSARNNAAFGPAIIKITETVMGPGGFFERTLNFSEILIQAKPLVMGLILVPFFAFFMLKDWPRVLKRVMDWIPPSYVETTISVVAEIDILVGKYLRGLAADCFSVGVLASLGLWLIGINYPIMLGILSGVANIVPYLGPIAGCLVSGLVALMQFNSFDAVLNVILLYVVIKLVDDLFIQPLMIGKSVQLHPMLLVITIIAGEKMFGISGMILGVPLVTAAQKTAGILLDHHRETLRRESGVQPIQPHIDKSPVRPV